MTAIPDRDRVLAHLRADYDGVFSEEVVQRHVEEYIALEPAAALVDLMVARAPRARGVLDIGSGYGSFVLAARQRGLDAVGIELAPFEVDYARRRLAALRPDDAPDSVYRLGTALELPFPDASFDAVTLWNVLEHVPDSTRVLAEAARVLRPGGRLFAVAPNYAAFRREAHYHVPWIPLIPRRAAVAYLRLLGRNPVFYAEQVYPCTNAGVRRTLRRLGLRHDDIRFDKLRDPGSVNHRVARLVLGVLRALRLLWLPRALVWASAANPVRSVIAIEAIKR